MNEHVLSGLVKRRAQLAGNIELTNEASGILPSPEWLRTTHNERWSQGQTANSSINGNNRESIPGLTSDQSRTFTLRTHCKGLAGK